MLTYISYKAHDTVSWANSNCRYLHTYSTVMTKQVGFFVFSNLFLTHTLLQLCVCEHDSIKRCKTGYKLRFQKTSDTSALLLNLNYITHSFLTPQLIFTPSSFSSITKTEIIITKSEPGGDLIALVTSHAAAAAHPRSGISRGRLSRFGTTAIEFCGTKQSEMAEVDVCSLRNSDFVLARLLS